MRICRFVCALGLALQGAWLVGCAEHAAVGVGCELLQGDLAIAEIMANPQDDDSGREWFEIYNTTSSTQVLDRLIIERLSFAGDGSIKSSTHTLRGTPPLESRAYFVLGDGYPGEAPIQYPYSSEDESFGALNNTVGGISLKCRDVEVDAVWYGTPDGLPEPQEGVSLSFDGGVAPDAMLNDRSEWWCAVGNSFDGVNRGTPGYANDLCGFATCDTGGGVMRDVATPTPGEIAISEVLADPAGTDAGKEWIEIYVAGARHIDLNGLKIVNTTTSGSSRELQVTDIGCAGGEPGDYLVIGALADPAQNGGVTVTAVAPGLELYAGAGAVDLYRGHKLIDRASVPDATSGKSASLDPMKLNPADNDQPESFCTSSTTGVFEGTGTPGQANDLCGSACLEGGTPRLVRAPNPGDLVITEVYPDPGSPPSAADNNREWIELYVAFGPVDLNGLSIVNTAASASTKTLNSANCLSVSQGAFVIIGGQSVSVDQVTAAGTVTGLTLSNSSTTVTSASVSVALGPTTLDAMSYPLPAQEGKSYSLTPTVLDTIGNDTATNWCWSTTPHLPFTGSGSPGLANDPCP
ncbi:MAG: hypothetical protein HY903_08695 [Deltaproteobacteria bacterium]|nr:hypothetical protein [Deltaproteobacteria bacterium]